MKSVSSLYTPSPLALNTNLRSYLQLPSEYHFSNHTYYLILSSSALILLSTKIPPEIPDDIFLSKVCIGLV